MECSVLYWNCAAGFLKKFDYLKDVAKTTNADIIFVSECEVKYEFDLGIFSLPGYDTVFSKTLISRKKSRLLCFKKPEFELLDLNNDHNEIITLSRGKNIICGLYRGFKCFEGESEFSNWERMLTDLNKLDYSKNVLIIIK